MPVKRFPSYGFYALLGSLAVLLLVLPVAEAASYTGVLIKLWLLLVLLLCVYVVASNRAKVFIACILAIPCAVGSMLLIHEETRGVQLFVMISNAVFYSFILFVLVRNIFASIRVDTNLIAGAISTYMLMGITWAWYFCIVEFFYPDSFRPIESIAPDASLPKMFEVLSYYSFVTLTTLGYGDMSPISPLAKSLSIIEATFAQIYLTVLVARLLGVHTAGLKGRVEKQQLQEAKQAECREERREEQGE